MKKMLTSLFAIIICVTVYIPAFADAEDEILMGHHWASPKYINEIHIQMIFMITALIILGTYKQVKRIKKSK
jgi:hypothetical protein